MFKMLSAIERKPKTLSTVTNEAHRGVGKWTVRENGTTEKVHSIDITPAMKKSVLHEGQPI
jgi:hypothetical protein